MVIAMVRGTTCEEVELGTGMLHQTASARRTDLRAAGYTDYLYEADGVTPVKRSTKKGRSGAKVQVVVQKGKDAINHGLPLQLNGGDPTRGRHRGDSASAAAFSHTGARRVLEYMLRFS
jgi:hypothetical protein